MPRISATVLVFILITAGSLLLAGCFGTTEDSSPEAEYITKVAKEPVIQTDRFGLPFEDYQIEERRVQRNETLSTILSRFSINGAQTHQIVQASSGVFDVRRIVSGRNMFFYMNPESGSPDYFVYQHNTTNYTVFDLTGDEPVVYNGQRDQDRNLKTIEGEISGSLYMSIVNNGGSAALVSELSRVYAWTIDFYRIQRGDRFTVVYEELSIDGETVGTGRIQAAILNHRGRDHHAIWFEGENQRGYFDLDGNSLQKTFLRAPLEYSRISSRFTNRRYHPVLRRNMPHHGTDYAAPTGTPIRAVGDGVITVAGYDRNNGNWIKIRHNSVYETGYLHMSRLAAGMRRGATVQQGQVIGYVGATGLATGPHLCFRFWKNNQPVDPYRIEMPPSEPIDDAYRLAFNEVKQEKLAMLNQSDPQKERPVHILTASYPFSPAPEQEIYQN